ncbi:MAG: hypothetical protein E6Q88_10400 [Lysobacteraceae bacterium]|nr:MAG: hypothetical protein E6Q88_10400 [Xanthomonadaceae bacterium]
MKIPMKSAFKAGLLTSSLVALAIAMPHSPSASASPQQDDAAARAAEPPAQPGKLTLLAAQGDDVSGHLQTASGGLSFQTRSLSRGQTAVRGASPERVQLRLEVNGAVLDHDIDYAAGTLTIRTPTPVVIDQNDREVLKSLQAELGRNLAMQGSVRSLPKSQDLLWRLSEMYSEIPLGYNIGKEWVIRRTEAKPIMPAANATAPANAFELLRPGNGVSAQGDVVIAACDERSGGSFINLHSIVDVCLQNVVYYRSSAHDFCPTHGYQSKTVGYGCGSSSCNGRCGAGCGVGDGLGAWYQDCLDHDVCNRDHNSQLCACGDEWTEAADDYAFGAISCYTTCH